jgi:tellurite resistance protein TerC
MHIYLWIGFNLFVFLMLTIDLGIFNKKTHEIHIKEALIWTAVWVTLSLLLNLGIYFYFGLDKALEFLTGYLIEKSLSMDNIFVFVVLFKYFHVRPIYQHKILFWGILGALLMRAIFIFSGIALLNKFHWLIYIFGAFLVFTGIKMFGSKEEKVEPEKNPVLKLLAKLMPLDKMYQGEKFFLKKEGKIFATPMLVALLVIETTDLIFAIDSIPAILAISRDPFIVYTSNIMAILGLRALYFALAGVMQMFQYLHYGLAIILIFVGIKMLIAKFFPIPILVALGFIAVTLLASVIFSVQMKKRESNA